MSYFAGSMQAIGIVFSLTILACLLWIAAAVIFGPRIDHDVLGDDEAEQLRTEAAQDHAVDVWGCEGCRVQAEQKAIRERYSAEVIEEIEFAGILAQSYPEGLPEFGGAA